MERKLFCPINHTWKVLRVESWVLFFVFWDIRLKKKTVVRREWFGAIVKILPCELLIYAKPISFMVGITNNYGGIFHQMYLLPWLHIFFLNMGAVDSVSHQHLCQDMQKYGVIVLMNFSGKHSCNKLIHNSTCIIFWRNTCMVPTR